MTASNKLVLVLLLIMPGIAASMSGWRYWGPAEPNIICEGRQKAGAVTVSWDATTHRVNGDIINDGELLFYLVQQIDDDNLVIKSWETAADSLSLQVSLAACECAVFHVIAAASSGPASHPDSGYEISDPSVQVSNC